MRHELPKSRFLRQYLWRLAMRNELPMSRFLGNIYGGWPCVMGFRIRVFEAIYMEADHV